MNGFDQAICRHVKQGYLGFHTPAHLGRNPFVNRILKGKYDVTELEETDNLMNPSGIIKELEQGLAQAFLAQQAHFLPNGATSGNLAALSLFLPGEKVILDRGSHLSAFRGAALANIQPIFTAPRLTMTGLPLPPSLEEIQQLLTLHPDCKGVFLTSPNYYGLEAEVEKIAALTKKRGIPLMVDEAHGAHRYFLNPEKTAASQGADLVVLSLHKNLPALTQSGALFLHSSHPRLSRIKEELGNFTSTSPSYLLMLSADAMLSYMAQKGKEKLAETKKAGQAFKKRLLSAGLWIEKNWDAHRLVVHAKEGAEKQLKEEYRILPELSAGETLVFLISLHHQKKELNQLGKALMNVALPPEKTLPLFPYPRVGLPLGEAVKKPKKQVPVEEAAGKLCGEAVLLFPPSVPVLLWGEEISSEWIPLLKKRYHKKTITVLDEE